MGKLQIPLEEIQDTQHKLLDVLHTLGPARIAQLINNAFLEPDTKAWHSSATCTATPKGSEKRYVPVKGSELIFLHAPPYSL